MKSHPDPARVLPADFDMRVQLEMGPLRGNRIDWVWNTRYIPDQEFLDMMRQACTVLKMVVTGHWAFMVKKLTPQNFLKVLFWRPGRVYFLAKATVERVSEFNRLFGASLASERSSQIWIVSECEASLASEVDGHLHVKLR
jgi:hypothetical protein